MTLTVTYWGGVMRCLTVDPENLIEVIYWLNMDDSVKAYYIHR